jgi:protocatechuate 3,4-dioxygenase beta subunit
MAGLALILLVAMLQDSAPAATPPAERLATIRGRVTDKETGLPLARAVVTIAKQGDSKQLSARTDTEGSYEFAGLEPGGYSGFVEAGEHRATHLRQGIVDPVNRRGTVLVAAGEVRADIDVALSRSFAITVRVVDEWGGPLSRLRVKVMDVRGSQRNSLSRTTDDLGRLRIYGLPPGRYVICAELFGFGDSGGRSGAAPDQFIGTCYPSAANEREAEIVQLEGADIENLEIRMRRGRTFSISGIVLDASGTPSPDAMMSFQRFERRGGWGTSIHIGPDARFTIANVSPGDYAITANIGGPYRPELRREPEAGYYPVRVDVSDVDGIVVTTAKTFDVHGRVMLEDAGGASQDTRLPRLMIAARLAGDPVPGSGSSRMAMMGEDRRFVLDGIFGRRTLEFANVPRGWYVKSIRYRGREVIDTSVEFTPDGGELDIILSARGAVIQGRVLDDRGNPLGRARVLMVRAGDDLNGLEPFTSVVASRNGEFRTGPARAGEYLLVALPPGSPHPYASDRDQLKALLASAERIAVGAYEERTVDLNVTVR